jgi:hypothetical protein
MRGQARLVLRHHKGMFSRSQVNGLFTIGRLLTSSQAIRAFALRAANDLDESHVGSQALYCVFVLFRSAMVKDSDGYTNNTGNEREGDESAAG